MFVNSNQISNSDLDDLRYFINEICSYNYKFFNVTNNIVSCTCNEGFISTNDTIFSNNQYIQCNYEQKKRYIVFFFSFFLLFGFEYLYLEKYAVFVFILIYIIFVIITSCYICVVLRETQEKEDLKSYFFIIFKYLPFSLVVWWILNNILIISGSVKDGNNMETYNDIALLFYG